jgi:hypothetical protein
MNNDNYYDPPEWTAGNYIQCALDELNDALPHIEDAMGSIDELHKSSFLMAVADGIIDNIEDLKTMLKQLLDAYNDSER